MVDKITKFMEILEDATIDFEGQIHNEAFASRVLTKMGCFDCDNGKQSCYMNCSQPTAEVEPNNHHFPDIRKKDNNEALIDDTQ
jgi:hypothetical protein